MKKLLKRVIPTNIKNKIKASKFINDYKTYKLNCEERNQNKYILFGTPRHGNIGDHAITIAIYQFFKDMGKNIFEVSSFDRHYLLDYIKNNIDNEDTILINGGGFMGSQWIGEEEMIRDVVNSFPNNRIVIFPQTVYYKGDEEGKNEFLKSIKIYNNHKNLIICTRENKSYDFVLENIKCKKVILIPDIVLYLNKFEFNEKKENALFCLRKDAEKSVNDTDTKKVESILKEKGLKICYTDTVVKYSINIDDRYKIFESKLREFSKYKIIVTDRLHGMIFAYLTNTPCIVFGNYNYKVKGVYEWIKESNFIKFVETPENIETKIKELLNYNSVLDSIGHFDKKYMFKELINLFI